MQPGASGYDGQRSFVRGPGGIEPGHGAGGGSISEGHGEVGVAESD